MVRKFVTISIEEFEEFLSQYSYKKLESFQSSEMVYDIYVKPEYPLVVRIFSSISPNDNITRDYGADAIRIVIINPDSHNPFKSMSKVLRIDSWKNNLSNRLLNAFNDVENYYKTFPEMIHVNEINARTRAKCEIHGIKPI